MEEIIYKVLKYANDNLVSGSGLIISGILKKVQLDDYIENSVDIKEKLEKLNYANVKSMSARRYIISRIKPEGKLFLERYEEKYSKPVVNQNLETLKIDSSANDTITVFMSYSWDNEKYKSWILNLANKLTEDGINIILDQYKLKIGSNLTHFMEEAVIKSDKVLLFLTENYKNKADGRSGGVGFEYSIINSQLYQDQVNNNKFLPIQIGSDRSKCIPTFLSPFITLDLSDESNFKLNYEELLRAIYEVPKIVKPKIGKRPNFDGLDSKSNEPSYEVLEKMAHISKKINFNEGFHMGEILIPIEYGSFDLLEFKKLAIEISKREDLGCVTFYSNKIGSQINNNKLDWNDEKMSKYYLGKIDITEKGPNWKDKITESDFIAYEAYWNKENKR